MKTLYDILMLGLYFIIAGCSVTKRGMLDDNTYFSTHSPNIQIKLHSSYIYDSKYSTKTRKVFQNANNGRWVVIDHYLQIGPENIIDYWVPSRVFSDTPNKIDLGEVRIMGKKWYYCDYFTQHDPRHCSVARKMALFTENHDWLLINYLQPLPQNECDSWKNSPTLDDWQKRRINNLVSAFPEDFEMTPYQGAK